jgi:arylsulfatase A-like enzyme
MTEEARVSPRGWGRAALFSLALGLSIFAVDQAISWRRVGFALNPKFSLIYAGILLAVGLAGIGATSLISRGRARVALRGIGAAGLFYLLVVLIGLAYKFSGDWTANLKNFVPVGFGLGLFAAIRVWSRQSPLSGARGLILMSGSWVLFAAWSLRSPESQILADYSLTWGIPFNAAFIALLVAVMYHVRRGWGRGIRLELAALIFLLVLIVAAGAAIRRAQDRLGQPAAMEAPAPDRPNIILIVWDTVRRDHLSVYGYERPTTPNLAAFARQSMVYNRAEAVAPWTLPSHVSMFTGLYPRTHGSINVPNPLGADKPMGHRSLSPQFPTLAEILTSNGYRCGGVSANGAYAGKAVKIDRGFEYFNDLPNSNGITVSHFDLLAFITDLIKQHAPESLLHPFFTGFPPADEVNRRAIRWVDKAAGTGRPFFLFLNFMDAHGPSYPPEELIHLFPGFQHDLLFLRSDGRLNDPAENEQEDALRREHLVSQYDAEIVFLDRMFQELLQHLQQRALLNKTIIILTSDHGDLFGEYHGIYGHRYDLYEGLLGIPLIIRYPDAAGAGVNNSVVENRSLFFTIQNMAGIKIAPDRHPWAAAEVFGQNPKLADKVKLPPGLVPCQRAFFFDHYKFISSNVSPPRLYDLQSDPNETVNLWSRDPEIGRRAKDLEDRFLQTIKQCQDTGQESGLSVDMIKKMKALGYIK